MSGDPEIIIPKARSQVEAMSVLVSGVATIGGALLNGLWVRLPATYGLILGGTGTVTLETRDRAGAITAFGEVYSTSSTETVRYPYFGPSAAFVRATLTETATAEIF